MLHAMIMAGGGGTRFWPRSRQTRPKQFLSFVGDRTLLQATRDRVAAQVPPGRTWVVTGAAHAAEVRTQLADVPPEQVVGEPVGRDTAAAVGLGAALIARVDPQATIAVMPADHAIEPEREFQRALHAAEQLVADYPDRLVTFGIPPTFPATGYGYIDRGELVGERQGVSASQAAGFTEKPNATTAERFLHSGRYVWNSGIFVWKATTILAQLRTQLPSLYTSIERIAEAWGTPHQDDVFRAEYEPITKISIDKGVMESAATAGNVLVIQAPYQWDDVGSWLALERRYPQDRDGNTIQGLHAGLDTTNCVIASDGGRLIGTIGVKDLLIIQSGDATLVADRRREDDVKKLVDRIKADGLERFL